MKLGCDGFSVGFKDFFFALFFLRGGACTRRAAVLLSDVKEQHVPKFAYKNLIVRSA